MDLRKLAAWLRQEHEALVQLTDVLKRHIAAMPQADLTDWLHGLSAAFERLMFHLERNFAAQETGGYMENLLELRPTISRRVEALKREHGELLRMGQRIREDLRATRAEERLLVADASARILRFMAVVAQHEQREDTLTLLVFNEDLGGES